MRAKKKSPPRAENSVIAQWTQQDKLELLSCWARDGYTDSEIAGKMSISPKTFQTWRLKCPEIDQAVRNGKEVVDFKVESALYEAAIGAKTEELEVIIEFVGDNEVKTIKKKKTIKHPPNVLACQTWLFNRQRDKWKRNRDNELTVEDDKSINITIKRAGTIEVEE
jgi:transposase-like protein